MLRRLSGFLRRKRFLAAIALLLVIIASLYLYSANKDNQTVQPILSPEETVLKNAKESFSSGGANNDPSSALIVARSYLNEGNSKEGLDLLSQIADDKLDDEQIVVKYNLILQHYRFKGDRDNFVKTADIFIALASKRGGETLKAATAYLNTAYYDAVFTAVDPNAAESTIR